MQVFSRRTRVRLEGALGLGGVRCLLLPVPVEERIHERAYFADLVLLELPAEDRRDILDHAAALRFVDRLRGRADEKQLRFLVAVLVVDRQVDLDCLVAVRPEVGERLLERRMETPANLAGPADVEDELLL